MGEEKADISTALFDLSALPEAQVWFREADLDEGDRVHIETSSPLRGSRVTSMADQPQCNNWRNFGEDADRYS